MARVLLGKAPPTTAAADWTLLVDERSASGLTRRARGRPHGAHRRGAAVADSLARALGANAEDRAAGLGGSAEGDLPALCGLRRARVVHGFRPLVGGPAESPDCVWREHLSRGLKEWWLESPGGGLQGRAIRVGAYAEVDPGHTRERDRVTPPFSSTSRSNHRFVRCWRMCGSAQAGMRTSSATPNACWRSAGLDPKTNAPTFLQLATLACRYADQSDRRGLARSFARLARIGLEPLVRQG